MSTKFFAFIVSVAVVVGGYYYLRQTNTRHDYGRENTLLVGTADDFPPFCFNKDDEIVGFDIDIAQIIAEKLHKKMVLKNMNFDILLLELQDNSIDMLAAGLTATPEREKRAFFTKPYLIGDPLLVVQLKKESNELIEEVEQLKGKKVVVNDAYTADQYVTEHEIDPLRVATIPEALLAIDSGQAHYFVSAEIPLKEALKKNAGKYTVTTLKGTAENCALAVTKKQPELFEKVQEILSELEADGTIETLKKKWNL